MECNSSISGPINFWLANLHHPHSRILEHSLHCQLIQHKILQPTHLDYLENLQTPSHFPLYTP